MSRNLSRNRHPLISKFINVKKAQLCTKVLGNFCVSTQCGEGSRVSRHVLGLCRRPRKERVMQRRHGNVSTHARSRKGASSLESHHHHQNHVMVVSWTRLLLYIGMICFVGTRVELAGTRSSCVLFCVRKLVMPGRGEFSSSTCGVFRQWQDYLRSSMSLILHMRRSKSYQCEQEQATDVSTPGVQKPLGVVLAKVPNLNLTSTRFYRNMVMRASYLSQLLSNSFDSQQWTWTEGDMSSPTDCSLISLIVVARCLTMRPRRVHIYVEDFCDASVASMDVYGDSGHVGVLSMHKHNWHGILARCTQFQRDKRCTINHTYMSGCGSVQHGIVV